MKIWVDADACPRMSKEIVFKVSRRLKVPVVMVANSGMLVPRSNLVSLVVVGKALDEADHHILAQAVPGDLVVTADIPLAAALVDRRVVVIHPRGQVYTQGNVNEALATRNLMQELREEGTVSGGPPPMSPRDREQFANAMDREMTRLMKNA